MKTQHGRALALAPAVAPSACPPDPGSAKMAVSIELSFARVKSASPNEWV